MVRPPFVPGLRPGLNYPTPLGSVFGFTRFRESAPEGLRWSVRAGYREGLRPGLTYPTPLGSF